MLDKLWLLNLLAPSFPNVKPLARDIQIALSDDLQDATSFPHKPLLNKTQELVKAYTILKVWKLIATSQRMMDLPCTTLVQLRL